MSGYATGATGDPGTFSWRRLVERHQRMLLRPNKLFPVCHSDPSAGSGGRASSVGHLRRGVPASPVAAMFERLSRPLCTCVSSPLKWGDQPSGPLQGGGCRTA